MLVLSVLSNFLMQGILFIGVLILINLLFDKMYEWFFGYMPDWVKAIVDFFLKTFGFSSELVRWVTVLLSFEAPEMKPNKSGVLQAGYKYGLPEVYEAHKQIGLYLYWISPMALAIFFSGITLKFMMPATYASIFDGLKAYAELSNVPFGVDLFLNIANGFWDIFWIRLVLGGMQESVLGFAIFVSLTILVFAQVIGVFFKEYLRCVPILLFLALITNFIFAIVNFEQYEIVARQIIGFGIVFVALFVFMSACCVLSIFFSQIIKKIFGR